MKKNLVPPILLAVSLFTPIIASAVTPVKYGQWVVSNYYTELSESSDPTHKAGSLHGKFNICLNADGSWYLSSVTPYFPVAMSGHWGQLGDTLHLHMSGGTSALGNWHDSGSLTIINPKTLAGHWQTWDDAGDTNNYGNVKWQYSKKVCDPFPTY